ncbi:MAG TPA: hypothetical protein GX711_02065 [Clostridia bacterium]|nr:hypothetical protein [Clostridia bacterium]
MSKMPQCLACGNTAHFVSSNVPALFPWNSTGSGLAGSFDANGNISNLENTATGGDMMLSAWERPFVHFDRCGRCGSARIQWP